MKKHILVLAAGVALGLGSAAHAGDKSCTYDGTMFSDGSTTCQAGVQFRCDDGDWDSLGVTCPKGDAPKSCEYDGRSYSSGSASCQSGTQYRCESGDWRSLGVSCPREAADAPRVIPPVARTCMMDGGSTVASGSTVCRSGVMFACDDGSWRNLGAPCQ